MVRYGTVTHVVDRVSLTLEVIIYLPRASVRRTVAAIFKVVITCHSGVTGVPVTEQ